MSSAPTSANLGSILRVAVPLPLRQLFDYLAPPTLTQPLQPGVRVLVPFGRRRLVGILIECPERAVLEISRLKPVLEVLDESPLFPAPLFRTLCWAASYYQHPTGEVFHSALPKRLRSGERAGLTEVVWSATPASSAEQERTLKRAYRQRALWQMLRERGENGLGAAEIRAAGFSRALLKQLESAGLATQQIREHRCAPFASAGTSRDDGPALNDEQQQAINNINAAADGFGCFLLEGVTGSGKTEVYMRLMSRVLARGRQCLVLVPEIGLTPQIIKRFRARFACPVVVLHSGLNDTERLDAWVRSRDGQAAIVIGTRSAVFAPLAQPGLIVVDEEHDLSFKQQEGFRYSARDLAVIRGREENVPVVLGSATPSLESLHNCSLGKFHHLRLRQRAGSSRVAAMEVIDVSTSPLQSGFSEPLLYRIGKHLGATGQVLVFLNRRGYAPVLSCRDCCWTAECAECLARFTVHARPPVLICHHCGVSRKLPGVCGQCQSPNLSTRGIGTQQIEQFLAGRFPQFPVLRIDRDSTRGKRRFERMLEQINRGQPCILLGTQMLAKGHHFPGITLVAVVDADTGLFSADFRGQEQMAQTVLQVAGRSGRAARPGEVLVQSRHAGHATVQSIVRGCWTGISSGMLAERRQAKMPPWAHLCLVRADAQRFEPAMQFLRRVNVLAGKLRTNQGSPVERIGPLPAPMERRAGRYRLQLMLKHRSRAVLQAFLQDLCPQMDSLPQPGGLRWSIDVDPLDML